MAPSLRFWRGAALLLPLNGVSALTTLQYCWYACSGAVEDILFEGVLNDCTNLLYLKSQYYCAATYCSRREIDAGFQSANVYCIETRTPMPAFSSLVPGAVPQVEVVNISILDSAATISAPVLIDQQFFDTGYKTVSAFYANFHLSTHFAYSCFGFWVLVVLVGIIYRVTETIKIKRTRTDEFSRASLSSVGSRLWLWIRRNLILPAAVGQHCQSPVAGCTIPPRLESILIAVYILLNFVYCFPSYDVFLPNVYYSRKRLQLVRYIADRTGIFAVANVPILWLFAARNDPLLWVTGWSFAIFNHFHRWVARLAVVEAIVHSIGYTLFDFYYGGDANYYADWKAQYWYCGQLATIVMSLMLVASVYYLRHTYYDLFLLLPIVLAIIFTVGMYYHLAIFGDEYKGYIWATVAIWSFDRLLRYGQIILRSVVPRLLRKTQAIATYDQQAEMIRFDVTEYLPKKSLMPGYYCFVYHPTIHPGWESHPFTLCSWRAGAPASNDGPVSPSSADEKDGQLRDDIRPVSTPEATEANQDIRHTFLVRPYNGFTGRLKTRLEASHESQSSLPVTLLLEGPYGAGLDLSRFSDVLIIAAGSGITAAISHSNYLLESGETRVHIVWATKQRKLVDDICKHELSSVVHNERVSMVVYLTGAAVVDEKDDVSLQAPYTWHFGRPNIFATIAEARQSCSHDLAVVSCGTPWFADVSRKAVVDVLRQDGRPVEYFNETLLW